MYQIELSYDPAILLLVIYREKKQYTKRYTWINLDRYIDDLGLSVVYNIHNLSFNFQQFVSQCFKCNS